MVILQGNCREINFGNSLTQDFALAAKSVPMLLKTAIHGGFSLDSIHFISEMTAFSQ